MGVQFNVVFKNVVRNGLERLFKALEHFCSKFWIQIYVVFTNCLENGLGHLVKALEHFCSELAEF